MVTDWILRGEIIALVILLVSNLLLLRRMKKRLAVMRELLAEIEKVNAQLGGVIEMYKYE